MYQPAAWIPAAGGPDCVWRDVLSPIAFDGSEWADIIGKNFRTASGPDHIQVGALRFCPERVQRVFLEIVNEYLRTQRMPSTIKKGTILLIPKLGEKFKFRPISLLTHLFKATERIVAKRISRVIEQHKDLSAGDNAASGILSPLQFAFLAGRSSVDCAGIVKAVLEDMIERRQMAMAAAEEAVENGGRAEPADFGHIAYLDLASYYDAITREGIELALRAVNMPEELIDYILEGGYEASSAMITPSGLSRLINLVGSCRQGNSLSCVTSTLVLSPLLRELELHPYTMLNGTVVSAAGYADDTCLMAATRGDLETQVQIVGLWSRFNRIALNGKKSDYVSVTLEVDVNGDVVPERSVPPPICLVGFDQDAAVDAAQRRPGSGRGAVAEIRIDGTALDAVIRHLGVFYTPTLCASHHGEQVLQRIGQVIGEAVKRELTPPQMVKCINGMIVPVGTYAVLESNMGAELAHRAGSMIVSTLRRAYRESAGTTYAYMFCDVRDGGAGALTLQMERLSCMAAELKLALNGDDIKAAVYRDRFLQAIKADPLQPDLGHNFIRDGIKELADYGFFIRYRAHEMVARRLDNAIPKRCPFRCAYRRWMATPPGGGRFCGHLFSDVSPLGRALHQRALRGLHFPGFQVAPAVLAPYGPNFSRQTLVAADGAAQAQLQSDFEIERRMAGWEVPACGRGALRACWRNTFGSCQHTPTWTQASDPWADLVDSVPYERQQSGCWCGTDGSRKPGPGISHIFGVGIVFAGHPNVRHPSDADVAALDGDELDTQLTISCPVPAKIGASATTVNTTEWIALKVGIAHQLPGDEEATFVDNLGVLSQYVHDTHGLPRQRRVEKGADHIWRQRVESVRQRHRDAVHGSDVDGDAGDPAVQPDDLTGEGWRERGGYGFMRSCCYAPAHKVPAHQDDKFNKACVKTRRAIADYLSKNGRVASLRSSSGGASPALAHTLATVVSDVLGSLVNWAGRHAVGSEYRPRGLHALATQGAAVTFGVADGNGELQPAIGTLAAPSHGLIIRQDGSLVMSDGELCTAPDGRPVHHGDFKTPQSCPLHLWATEKFRHIQHLVSPNWLVMLLNDAADQAANDGADASSELCASQLCPDPQWLRYPFGGSPFGISYCGGLVTGNARRFVRSQLRQQALAYASGRSLRDQGALQRNRRSLDMALVADMLRRRSLSPFQRRLMTGSVAAQNMQRHRFQRLADALPDGIECFLCRGAQLKGNFRHLPWMRTSGAEQTLLPSSTIPASS